MKFALTFPLTLLGCLITFSTVHGDELAEASRAILAKHATAVVTIKIAVEINFSSPNFGSEEEEFIIEATGFLINPRGFVAASLTATDPAGYYEDYLDDDEFEIRTEINEVTILLDDGSSFAASMALRDRDLDVVIIQPKKEPQGPLNFIRFADNHLPQTADSVVILRRLGKVAGRACIPLTPRIDHILKKPRLFYLVHDSSLGLGEPAFSTQGACFGMVTLRSINLPGTESFSVFSADELDSVTVILPGENILEIAQQVPGFNHEDKEDPVSPLAR